MTETDPPRGPVNRVAVIIPTYNERENLEPITVRVRSSVPAADLLVVDDNSPDGTGELADKLAAGDPQIHVLHRPGKSGLGAAYIAGFGWALERGYDAMVEMDADGSHEPAGPAPAAGRAAGRRRWSSARAGCPAARCATGRSPGRCCPAAPTRYARIMLGLAVHDTTAGFRAYRAQTLRAIGLDSVRSQGYCFQIDLTLRAVNAGLTVVEVPITFVDRMKGASKMSRGVMVEAFWRVAQWGVAQRLHGRRPPGGQQASGPGA